MKIEVLRLGNLNSLRGEHEIRFDEPPLADSGLFAIVGETGAGKTTLLDAITLSLYGQIDREKENKGGGSRIMTWGTGWCYAEIEFTTDRGRYLCRWERSRAYKKAEGKLQAADHKLSVWEEEVQKWKFLSEKVSDTQKMVPEICGLDYERFTRSVMLPQGAFARFLLADENERADLLEQITGTGIYRQISMAAYERNKLAGQELQRIEEQLSNLRLLSQTEREVVETTLGEQQQALEPIKTQLAAIGSNLKLYQRQKEMDRETTRLAQQRDKLRQQFQEQQSERARLAASDRLTPLAEELRTHGSSQQQLGQLSTQLKQLNEKKEVALAALKTTQSRVEQAQRQYNEFAAKLAEREAKIDRALALESQVGEIVREENRLANVCRTAEQQAAKIAETVRQREQRLAQAVKAAEALKIAISQELAVGLDALDLDDLPLLLQEHLATSLVKKEELDNQLQQIRSWGQQLSLTQKMEALGQQHAVLEKALDAATKAEAAAVEQQQTQRSLLRQLQQSLQLQQLKSSVQAGEPCPVCGALDHPALAHWEPPSEALVEEQRKCAEVAEADLKAAQQRRQAADKALASHQQNIIGYQERLQELRGEWQQRYGDQPQPVATDPAQFEQEKQQLQSRIEQLKSWQKTAGGLLQEQSEKALRQDIMQLRIQQKNQEAILEEERPKWKKAQGNLASKRKELTDLLGNNTVAEAKAKLKARGDQCQQQLDIAKEAFQGETTKQAELDSQMKLINADAERVREQLQTNEEMLKKRLATLGVEDIDTARAQLLPAAQAQELRRKFTALDQEMHATSQQLKSLRDQQESSATILMDLPPEVVLLQQQAELEKIQKEFFEKMGALRQQLKTDQENRAAAGHLTEALQVATKEKTKWATLDELIGSAKGDRFSRFAQSLTLERLVAAANEQLVELLDGRYRIDRAPSVYKGKNPLHLGLEIIDTYQADNRRDTRTLSGGESFLVSLALALGLSDLAGGQTRIRSLFIDEGFGSLDQGLLDTVIDTLENLRSQGKTIGLISHVKALRERIHHKIIVEKRGDGFSELVVI